MKKHKAMALAVILTEIFLLMGCTTTPKVEGQLTMSQIYNQETGFPTPDSAVPLDGALPAKEEAGAANQGNSTSNLPLTGKYVGEVGEAQNQINAQFKAIPNPTIPIYVYPHLVYVNGDASPVPGYTTEFFLFKQNHWAMPSEVF